MKKLWILFTLLYATSALHADDTTVHTLQDQRQAKVRLQFEIVKEDVEPLGLKLQNLQSDMMTKLIQSHIGVEDNAQVPLLLLRVKTIEIDSTVASFIQLAFLEDAELLRNHGKVSAITWSEASLLTTSRTK